MEAGKLRHRITIEQPNRGDSNPYGERSQAWTPFATVWAQVGPVSAEEQDFARTFASTVTHRVLIRYWPGITPTMRVNFNGRYFSLDGIVNSEEQNISLTLYCTEKVG